jgi:hypothetical protein
MGSVITVIIMPVKASSMTLPKVLDSSLDPITLFYGLSFVALREEQANQQSSNSIKSCVE